MNLKQILQNIGNFIIPIDEVIFFRGVQTTNQIILPNLVGIAIIPRTGNPELNQPGYWFRGILWPLLLNAGFLKWEIPNSWMVSNGKSKSSKRHGPSRHQWLGMAAPYHLQLIGDGLWFFLATWTNFVASEFELFELFELFLHFFVWRHDAWWAPNHSVRDQKTKIHVIEICQGSFFTCKNQVAIL